MRERITVRREATPEEREAKTKRVMAAGKALAAGDPAMKALAPEWDARWMKAIESGDLDALATLGEADITREAGLSAHESKTWVIARAAMPAGVPLQSATALLPGHPRIHRRVRRADDEHLIRPAMRDAWRRT